MSVLARVGKRATFVMVAMFAFLLAFAVAASPARAEETAYPVWVQGTQITSENADDVFGDGTVKFVYGESDVSMLVLEDADLAISDKKTSEDGDAAAIYSEVPLEIVLVGENTISADSAAELSAAYADGICMRYGNLEFTGNGSLDVVIPASVGAKVYEEGIFGIYPFSNSVTIGGAAKLSFDLVPEGYRGNAAGIAGNITVKDIAEVTIVIGPVGHANGLTGQSIEITDSANVTIDIADGAQGDSDTWLTGIDSTLCNISCEAIVDVKVGAGTYVTGVNSGTLTVTNNATVYALAGEGDEGSYGVAGQATIKELAIVDALGDTQAFANNPDVSDSYYSGQIYVNEDYDAAVAAADMWDFETALGGSDSPYKYVRIGEPTWVMRLAGDYANETAAIISEMTFPKSEWVVIARDDDFADALGATGLAGVLDAPIVLTNREELSEAAAAEITRLEAKHAYIIGGTGAIKEQVDADLAALGVTVEPRIWGDNSYDTSLACAEKIVELGGNDEEAIVAVSFNFQDALSISPIAYMEGIPIVLQTWGDTAADRGFTDDARAWLEGKDLCIVGGIGAISDESLDGLHPLIRLWGESGYDTSNEIAKWGLEIGCFSTSRVVFACGAQAPKGTDALAGSALAAYNNSPILLVNSNEEMEGANLTTIEGYFAEHALSLRGIYVLGGEYVVPADLFDLVVKMTNATVIDFGRG